MFATALHLLKSPQNVGMIVRSHVAFGGRELVFIGHELPWRFRKGTQSFSRNLERQCEILYCRDDESFFQWCDEEGRSPIAVEISPAAATVAEFRFPAQAVLVVGNEATGLAADFIDHCDHQVLVPQFGAVGSLNVAVACSIAQYEHARQWGMPVRPGDGSFAGENRKRVPDTV